MGSIDIRVDLEKMGISGQLTPVITGAIQGALQTSLAVVRDRWQTEVQNKLNSSRPLYLQGLQWDSVVYPYGNAFTGAVVLKGKFPNMLETGFTAFDMKVWFSKSDRKITKKDGGWYLTIPMRHSTPGSFMYGRPMPRDIYGLAKNLAHKESLSIKGQGDVSWTGYQRKHKTYDGLTRIVKSYQKATQSYYMTFRRVSNNSDSLSWWHPGYEGVKVAPKLESFAEKTFTDLLKYNLNNLG